MLTLYHAPMSRSTNILQLVEEMGLEVQIETVSIPRQDGSGGPDPKNPHPEKKVPLLVDGDEQIRERGAIILYLTDMVPDSPLGRPIGDPKRGAYLKWLFYYQGVMEPILTSVFGQIDHPAMAKSFGTVDTMVSTLEDGLKDGPYLLGEDYSAADLLCASPFIFFPDFMPQSDVIRAWVARCADRPALTRVMEREQAAMAG
ncbi:glutathione S-transferase family protein [Paracoccaceae bacterium GXU_MW_L88]